MGPCARSKSGKAGFFGGKWRLFFYFWVEGEVRARGDFVALVLVLASREKAW
jgi:hypothetical protein